MNSHTHDRDPLKLTPNQSVVAELPRRHSPLALFAVLATLLATLTLSGCVGLTSAGTPAKTSSGNPPSGTLAASATSFSFGNVATGSSNSQTLTLTNTGTAAVAISQATVTGAGFSIVGGMTSVSIAAGQYQAFQVQFAPQAPGSVSGSIVVASDASDSALSVSLSGTGMATVSITTQPASQTVTAGQTATFAVTATGTGTVSYQWKKNGGTIGGATSSTYTTPATTNSDNGAQFTVVVSDSSSSVTSNAALLTVTAAPVAPSITAQPASQAVTAGQTATFSVTAAGTATLTYQWKKNGTAIGGATSASYTTPSTAASDSGAQFTVTVTNSVGNVTSNAATLTVNVPPTITTQPVSKTVTVGQTVTFTVAASGSGVLSYQWKKNGATIGGATLASYTTPATTASDNGAQFTVTVTASSVSVTSSAATLTVNVSPSITTQPASKTVIAGQTATFSVTAAGTATLTYQWKKNGTAIGGATSASYTTPATTTSDSGAQFTVTVTNIAGNVTSNAATLTVNAATFLLNANKTSLAFGNVNIGSNSILGVTLTNTGNSNVTVSNVTIAGAGFTASGVSTGQILTPGQTATLNVTFTPATAVTVPGSVTVNSNATNSPATVTLSGTGIQPVSHSVSLSWTASTSTVAGYNGYQSTVSGGPYTKVNSALVTTTQFTDSTVLSGQTYFYVVTSVDSSNAESVFSNEVSATIP
jgi:hypothetical protein